MKPLILITRYIILSKGCEFNFSNPTWVHKTGRYVLALYAGGRGLHCGDIRTENCSSKLTLNLSDWLSKLCSRIEPAFVRNLFQIGHPSALIDMLKHSARLPVVWYPASLCVRKVDVWHNRKMAAYTDRKQNGCSLYKAYGALAKSVIAIDRGPAKCRHSADVSPNSYRFRKYSSGYLP